MDLRTKLRLLVNELPERGLETAASYLEFLKARYRDQAAAQELFQDEETEIELKAEPKKAKWPFVLHNLGPRRWEKNWGNGSEEVEATVFRTEVNGRQLTLTVGQVVDGRWAYGDDRVRFHVARGSAVVAEFAGTDDYDQTRRVFSLLKSSDGKHITDYDDVPEDYRAFQIEPLADLVDDGIRRHGLAVVVQENDLEAMAVFGILRLLERGKLK